MNVTEMLQQSALLTVVGMSVVFIFLAFMVICINLSGKFFNRKKEGED